MMKEMKNSKIISNDKDSTKEFVQIDKIRKRVVNEG